MGEGCPILLDEPTSGLDPIVRDEVLDILRCVAKEKNTSVLFSSHITEDIEKIADRVIFINNGRILLKRNKEKICQVKSATVCYSCECRDGKRMCFNP